MTRANLIMIAQILYRNKPVKKGPQMSLWRKIRDNFVETLSVSSFKFNKVKFIEYTETGYVYRNAYSDIKKEGI